MWWTNFIQNFFLLPKNNKVKKKRTIKDLNIFDSVWIKDEDIIFEGWVFDITRRCIIVVYGRKLVDFRFRMEKPLDRIEIQQDGKILYCNEPDEPYIKLSK